MRSIYVYSSFLLLLASCAHSRVAQNPATRTSATATAATSLASHFHGDTATANGSLMLLGEHPREDLEEAPFASWFNKNYANYVIHKDTTRMIGPLLSGLSFEIFMGTWCPDSRREVPRMLKILDACHVPSDRIRIIMVDYRDSVYKQSPEHQEKGRDIQHVPDLLVLDQGREMGRIVESPVVTLENDLLAIAGGARYEPHYPGAYWLSARLRLYPPDQLEDRLTELADSLRGKTEDAGELAAYSRIFLTEGDTARALFLCRLNRAIYPADALTYTYQGWVYLKLHEEENARKAYLKALEIDPANKAAKGYLDSHPPVQYQPPVQ
jgi:hypothetical protein